MDLAALALVVAAAITHASWNLLIAREPDSHVATAGALLCGTLLFAPVAALTWHVEGAALPYLAATIVLELGYLLLLGTAYSEAAISLVYPIARGSAPVLVLAIGVVVLGAHSSLAQAAGVLGVAAGVVLVRGFDGRASARDLVVALGIGACIAGYTLVDKHGVGHAAPFAYLWIVFSVLAVGYAGVIWRRGGGALLRTAVEPRMFVVGLGFFGAYGLALLALQRAGAAPVAAVRESSVVIVTFVAARSLDERVDLARAVGAGLVVAGVAAIALG